MPYRSSPFYATIQFLLCMALGLFLFSCNPIKYYIKNDFRQTYTDVNAVLHSDTTQFPFFKVHFKNGEVSLLNNWQLSSKQDSIIGEGTLYDFNRNQINVGEMRIALVDIAIIETNQLEEIKSKDKERVSALTVLTIANVAVGLVCLTNPKACFGSCPTFYIDGQQHFHSANAESFSSSIAPALEKADIDALQYRTSASSFALSMKNEALETHLLNQIQIQAVPKNKYEQVFQSPSGQYYRCGPLHVCKSAMTEGQDVRPALRARDDLEYFSPTDSFDLSTSETLIVEFDDLSQERLGLVLNFRQTLVTTFLLYSGLSYMGDDFAEYFTRMETDKRLARRMATPFDRLGGIKLYVWQERPRRWQLFGEVHETGPIARNLMMVPMPDRQESSGKLKVKIEMAKGLWRLDYVGLSAIYENVEPYKIQPVAIEVVKGNETTVAPVLENDDHYLSSFPGDEFRFQFELPELADDQEYELFLYSKGYYLEWMRQVWLEDKDPEKLRKLLMNDAQVWRELSLEYKQNEIQMENQFWDSKYIAN